MTQLTISATTLNFDEDGFLKKSEFMGFTIDQVYKTGSMRYVAYLEERQFTDDTLGDIISEIIEYRYEQKAK